MNIEEKEARWEKKKARYIANQKLKKEKQEFYAKYRKPLTTTKKLALYIFINCTIVEIYAMIVMFIFRDLSSLYTLISAIVTEGFGFAIYCYKSTKENSAGGITFEQAMRSQPDPEKHYEEDGPQ